MRPCGFPRMLRNWAHGCSHPPSTLSPAQPSSRCVSPSKSVTSECLSLPFSRSLTSQVPGNRKKEKGASRKNSATKKLLSKHFYSSGDLPGPVLSAWQVLFYSCIRPIREMPLLSPFYKVGSRGSKRQQACSRAWVWHASSSSSCAFLQEDASREPLRGRLS